ncbi:MAG: HlyD family efflux transporter periplasmic adaptor subunit [Brevefilum sp.]|nr:HlyD family efflux transporter periplasmic adaptor subunit [Brevefilum sp.]
MKRSPLLRNRLLLLASILLLFSTSLSACSNDSVPAQDTPGDQAALLVQEVSASGEVIPLQWASLSYPSGAENFEVKIIVGDEVTKNQVLVTSNDSRLMAGLYQAQSALERAQFAYNQIKALPTKASLAAAKAALANAEANLERQENAFASDAVIAAAEADVAAAQANLQAVRAGASRVEIEAALQDLRAAEFALKQAEAAFDIRAPFSGTIVEVLANPGEPIGAFQPLLILADLSEIRVRTTDLSEVDVPKLREGQTATIFFDALSDQSFTGTIERIADKPSGVTSVYYEVTLKLNQVPTGLRWGMTAFITFPLD